MFFYVFDGWIMIKCKIKVNYKSTFFFFGGVGGGGGHKVGFLLQNHQQSQISRFFLQVGSAMFGLFLARKFCADFRREKPSSFIKKKQTKYLPHY